MIRRILAAAAIWLGASAAAFAVDVQQVTSPGGIHAWLVEEHSIPFTALEIRFKGGAALDEPGKRGAINLMVATLEEGAGDMDARSFAAAREGLAASYQFDVFNDTMSISARFLSENRDEAVALLRQAVIDPRFDQTAIDRVRQQVLSIITSDATDPNRIAGRTFDAMAFGDHPYGANRNGTAASVTALTRDDIVTAYRNVLTRERIYVGAVGDITADELGAMLDSLLGDLPATGPALPADVVPAIDGSVTVVDFDTPQSVILFGHRGIRRDDPDYVTAYILNEIFGGSGFNSRLMEEVREKRGLTYSIGAFLAPMNHSEMIYGQAQTANERAWDTVRVVREEWGRIAQGVTQDELDEAKTYLTGAYPLRFDGNARIAGILVGMQMAKLPVDYINTRNDLVNAVTLDDIRRVAKRLYHPDELQFVIVGQPGEAPADN